MGIVTEVVDRLNDYNGKNIWQDIIHDLDIDWGATEDIDPRWANDRFVLATGHVIRWNGASGQWCDVGSMQDEW
jgi:hypothetical protein